MIKLFRAAICHTDNRIVIVTEWGLAVFFSVFLILNGYFQNNQTNAYVYKLVSRFFGYVPMMCIFIAVFSAHLWGTDYEYGILRNKLICGHTREQIYFSNLLIIVLTGLGAAVVWLIINGTLGLSLLGTASLNLSPSELVLYILFSFLMITSHSCVCCLTASFMNKKSSSTLLCLGTTAAMIILGMLLYDRFAEPEFSDGWMSTITNPTTRWHPENIRYISGTSRIFLELIICLTPGGQSVILCEEGVEHLFFLPLCSVFVTLSTSVIGTIFFRNKDLK